MPGVDYRPDPEVDHVAPTHLEFDQEGNVRSGSVGNVLTAAQLDELARTGLQRDREAVGAGERAAMPPTGNPGPKVVDSDPEAGPDVKPGGHPVLDYAPDLDHEIEVLDKERAALEGRLADLRRRKEAAAHPIPQTSADQRLTDEQKRAIQEQTSLARARTETERADERIRERAADERGGPSVFPDRTRSAEEQATAERHGDEGLVPHRPRLAEEQTPAGSSSHPERERQEREPAEQHPGAAQEKGKPEVPGPAGPRGKRDAGKK
jgi:hypothetical protein